MKFESFNLKISLLVIYMFLFHFAVHPCRGQGLYEYIDLNRASWPHIKFIEGGVDVARIQGVGGKFAVTSTDGAVQLFTVNTSNGNAELLTSNHRFYIHEDLSLLELGITMGIHQSTQKTGESCT